MLFVVWCVIAKTKKKEMDESQWEYLQCMEAVLPNYDPPIHPDAIPGNNDNNNENSSAWIFWSLIVSVGVMGVLFF